ncbi:TetR/AcrR family transcriptional regulator [Hyphomonas sp. WL0036]|uniref:helix-turn-helix domain-containing protein n=1 Tax=Hyphomonas sediminis TaxID=2866160 RepID=UPI001C8244AE|nr:helix-turn-helix domain-containing protein [Hyphomonas sediminis]MBY9066771.1 TetR/AcrR family transcriptional regulator [Hyphomonas sediminis]
MVRLHEKSESEAADALKRAALKLFAERGVDGVTVREIAAAAGQRNHGAVGYHFGSKAEMIRTLVVDGAQLINERRITMLNEMEASGRAISLEDVLGVMVYPSIDVAPQYEEECFNRFIVLFSMTHRALFLEILGGRWNSGFQRCLEYLRGFMGHLPKATQTERIIFIESYLGSVLAAREARLADTSRVQRTWARPATLDHLVATMAAIVRAP